MKIIFSVSSTVSTRASSSRFCFSLNFFCSSVSTFGGAWAGFWVPVELLGPGFWAFWFPDSVAWCPNGVGGSGGVLLFSEDWGLGWRVRVPLVEVDELVNGKYRNRYVVRFLPVNTGNLSLLNYILCVQNNQNIENNATNRYFTHVYSTYIDFK